MIPILKSGPPALMSSHSIQQKIESFQRETENLPYWRQKAIRFRLPPQDMLNLKHALLSESHQKCVYCEQSLHGPGFVELDHFRPISGALDDKGERSDLHYYWLAYDWSNMLASCPECNRAKGPKFPVASDRVGLRMTSPDLDAYESPMLLNPTRYFPGKDLSFSLDGRVHELSLKGAYTISILKLNREHLVERRLAHLEKMKYMLDQGDATSFLMNDAEFAGMCRELHDTLSSSFAPFIPPRTDITPAQQSPILSAEDETRMDASKYYSTFPLIREIQIDGLWGLDSVDLTIPAREDGSPGWLSVLGENGVGKSSILRALALVLYDGNALDTLALKAADLLNNDKQQACITVHFDTGQRRVLRLDRNGPATDLEEGDKVPILLLGYGATRLAANQSHPFRAEAAMGRIANLFNPYIPLREPSEWLASLDDERFDYAAAAIKNLLNLDDDCYLSRPLDEPGAIRMNWFGTTQQLHWLSQGYQNVLALACDIMAVAFEKWSSPEAAQCIVLLDELENHLHPAWKMRIVTGLRVAFPRMQFIVTTHDPLCLRGLFAGEVALLTKSSIYPHQTQATQELPSVADMRIDQILTSAYFGLRSTVDPRTQELFDEYYQLLDRETPLQENEAVRLKELELAVRKYDNPALLDRDRLLYAAIDRYLAARKSSLLPIDTGFDTDLLAEIDDLANALAAEEPRLP